MPRHTRCVDKGVENVKQQSMQTGLAATAGATASASRRSSTSDTDGTGRDGARS